MLYRFQSRAGPDVLMFGADGELLLQVLRKPPQKKGVLTPEQLPQAIAALQAAVTLSRAAHAAALAPPSSAQEDADAPTAVEFHQRVAPLLTLLERALGAQQNVVWGL